MLEGVKFPTSITDLNASLTDVKRDDFAHISLRK
jgi:hypothetical protein